MISIIFLLIFSSNTYSSQSPILIKVPIIHFEPLSHTNTKTPTKASSDLMHALNLATKVFDHITKSCGYISKLESFHFKEDSPIELAHLVQFQSTRLNPWFIVGPRQSQHYLIQTNIAPGVPSFSPLASSEKVFELPAIHRTFAHTPQTLTKLMVQELKHSSESPSYLSLVKTNCPDCKNHSDQFDKFAKLSGFIKIGHIDLESNTPNLDSIFSYIVSKKPKYILIPNYWDVSFYIIDQINKSHLSTLIFSSSTFLAFDGWGDPAFGLFTNVDIPEHFKAIVIRSLPLAKIQLNKNKTYQLLPESKTQPPMHGAGAVYISALENFAKFICIYKPMNSREFSLIYQQKGRSIINNNSASLYYIKNRKFFYVKQLSI